MKKETDIEVLARNVAEVFSAMNKGFTLMEKCFAAMDKRFDTVDKRLDDHDERFNQMDDRFDRIDERFDRMDDRFDRIEHVVLETNRTIDKVIMPIIDEHATRIKNLELKIV